jgi:hypothetical protein
MHIRNLIPNLHENLGQILMHKKKAPCLCKEPMRRVRDREVTLIEFFRCSDVELNEVKIIETE